MGGISKLWIDSPSGGDYPPVAGMDHFRQSPEPYDLFIDQKVQPILESSGKVLKAKQRPEDI